MPIIYDGPEPKLITETEARIVKKAHKLWREGLNSIMEGQGCCDQWEGLMKLGLRYMADSLSLVATGYSYGMDCFDCLEEMGRDGPL